MTDPMSTTEWRAPSNEAGPARDPLYRLLAWLSPAYPIGAFSYSHGVETAVEEALIRDRASLVAWLDSIGVDAVAGMAIYTGRLKI